MKVSLSRRSFMFGTSVSMGLLASTSVSANQKDSGRGDRLRYQGLAGIILYPELADALGYLAPLKLEWVGNTTSGPQDLQAATTGDTDFGEAFNGAIMKLIVSGAPVKAVLAYGGADKLTSGSIFVRKASSLRAPRDLIGKTIGVNTLMAEHECFIEQYLQANGLTDTEIRSIILVAIPPVVAEQALRHGRVDAVVLSNVFREVALQHNDLLELTTEYALYGAGNTDSIILRNSYMEAWPQSARHFTEATARAISWAQTTPPDHVRTFLISLIKNRKRGESTLPARYWRSTSVVTRGGYIRPEDFARFQPWYAWRGDTRTATLPADTFYTNTFNPEQTAQVITPL
ncbi:ABC transporter substrate-binding protein [Acetobacter tropicalis]|nr:ABC transporter substrate-binding protein [Acetobacter tropicalis]